MISATRCRFCGHDKFGRLPCSNKCEECNQLVDTHGAGQCNSCWEVTSRGGLIAAKADSLRAEVAALTARIAELNRRLHELGARSSRQYNDHEKTIAELRARIAELESGQVSPPLR